MTGAGAPAQRPVVTFLGSPFLGPSVWEPVADRLRDLGWPTRVGHVAGRSPAEVLDSVEASLPDEPTVLVPHSNAGLYVPAVASVVPLAGVVFVDAALAPPHGEAPLAPPAAREHLRGLVDDDGLLPPWPRWWPRDDVRALVPDDDTLDRLTAEAPRLPLAYVEATVTVPPGWERGRRAYLALGDTYAAEAERARAAGWPTETLPGGHLHMLVDPDGMAATIAGLLARI